MRLFPFTATPTRRTPTTLARSHAACVTLAASAETSTNTDTPYCSVASDYNHFDEDLTYTYFGGRQKGFGGQAKQFQPSRRSAESMSQNTL